MDDFKSLRGYFQRSSKKATVDNFVFRLHYNVTVAFILGCVFIGTAYALFGVPMLCMSNDDIPKDLLDQYCWVHTTFSVEGAWNKTVGDEVPYPGVETFTKDQKRVFHAYYQWVCFFLVFISLCFYCPKYFWRNYENHKVANVIQSLGNPVLEDKIKNKQRGDLVEYFHKHLGDHGVYSFAYITAEVMNFVNVVGQIFFIDFFLNGYFLSYGTDVFQHSEYDYSIRYDPMIRLFPRVTKCSFHRYGASGSLQKHDTLCVLPINIINEKIFIFLWFWFLILAVLSGLALIYRIMLLVVPKLQVKMIFIRSTMINREHLEQLVSKISFSDWMFLNQLAKNIYPLTFNEVVSDLAFRLEIPDRMSESKA